jgi:3-hydroxybutyryl-CoA dehydrogenase
MFDPHSESLTLAVIGAGVMGQGIAQIAAQAGVAVRLYDGFDGVAQRAHATLAATFGKLVERGRFTPAQAQAAMARVSVATSLQELADADVVVEAIIEKLEAKQALFQQLEAIVGANAVLATNTSSLSVTAIAAGCAKPARVVGFHFFNPVPLMKIVEVIEGARTDATVGDAMLALGQRMGHRAVRAKDTPGFIVNHAGRGFGTEALRLLGESVGSPAAIDEVLRGQGCFRLGPFELFDLVGLDVSVPVMESVYRQYFDEPRFRPSPLTVVRQKAGLLGRKSGSGFYTYTNGLAQPTVWPTRADAAPGPVWVSRRQAAWGQTCAAWLHEMGAQIEETAHPSQDALCIVLPLGEDVTACVAAEGLDAMRTVALDWLLPQARCAAVFTNPLTSAESVQRAVSLLRPLSTSVRVLRDSTGLVGQRVLATIVNIGCDIAQQGIASPQDIDAAVTLGLGYPQGPLAWGDALGPRLLLQILRNLEASTGDPRYRPSPWLRRRAELGTSLLTFEHEQD